MPSKSDHRKPPLPSYYESVPEGTCRWCNTSVGLTKTGKASKSRWHQRCLLEFKLIHWPTKTRQAVWKRDLGRCAKCGFVCARKGTPKWHMDHIVPLVDCDGNIKYWMMPNLQTLCHPCHKIKTSIEATERAIKRREAKLKPKPDA